MSGPITVEADLDSFRKAWIEECDWQKRHPNRKESRGWQGAKAIEELERRDALFLLLPDEEDSENRENVFWEFSYLVVREIHAYNRCVHIPQNKKCFRDALDAIAGAKKRLRIHLENAEVKLDVQKKLADCGKALEKLEHAIEKDRTACDVEKLLNWSLQERKQWKEKFANEHEFADWWRYFEKFRYPRDVTGSRDLDSRIQGRLALILMVTLDVANTGVSLSTIASLVVLIYKCGKLVEKRNDKLVVRNTNGPLIVSAVAQRLGEVLKGFRGD